MSANNVNSGVTTAKTEVPTAGASIQPQGSVFAGFMPILLIMIAFYFLLFRPQQKREAKRREMINAVKKGDRIITIGGVIGVIHKIVDEREISLEISENVRIRVLKNAITEVLGQVKTDISEGKNLKKIVPHVLSEGKK